MNANIICSVINICQHECAQQAIRKCVNTKNVVKKVMAVYINLNIIKNNLFIT